MRRLLPHLAFLALLVLVGTANAGEAVRLLVEVASDLEAVNTSERVAVQVVGQDASGARVGFGKSEVVFETTAGKVEVVERPYSFRYLAPDDFGAAKSVTLTARLADRPSVQGTLTIPVARPKSVEIRFRSLAIEPRRREVPLGGFVALDVVGIRADGSRESVVGLELVASVTSAKSGVDAGTVEAVQLSRYRYRAPAPGAGLDVGDRVAVVIHARDKPELQGRVELELVAARKRTDERTETPTAPPPPPAEETADGDAGSTEDKGVLTKDGHLRFMVWRTRNTAEEEFTNSRRLPDPPTEFASRAPWHKLRLIVERPRVSDIVVEWWTGTRVEEQVKRIKATKDGPLRYHRNKAGKLVVHLEMLVPEGSEGIKVELVQTGAKGHVHRDRFRMRRGKRRDAAAESDPPR